MDTWKPTIRTLDLAEHSLGTTVLSGEVFSHSFCWDTLQLHLLEQRTFRRKYLYSFVCRGCWVIYMHCNKYAWYSWHNWIIASSRWETISTHVMFLEIFGQKVIGIILLNSCSTCLFWFWGYNQWKGARLIHQQINLESHSWEFVHCCFKSISISYSL